MRADRHDFKAGDGSAEGLGVERGGGLVSDNPWQRTQQREGRQERGGEACSSEKHTQRGLQTTLNRSSGMSDSPNGKPPRSETIGPSACTPASVALPA